MSMFRFWSSDSRGSEKTIDGSAAAPISQPDRGSPVACGPSAQAVPLKRSHCHGDDDDAAMDSAAPAKRPRAGSQAFAGEPASPTPGGRSRSACASAVEGARDLIQAEFCQEILLKHRELRLINQELAKCQIALEQLRRCHLIPYPVNCPTPQQMLHVSTGMGPAVVAKAGDAVPRWAPPFGVVDGPYSRHYAKWLIPDPAFDGLRPELSHAPARGSVVEGRTTRNSSGEIGIGLVKGRRGNGAQRFESLSSGYPPPKDKVGPCVSTRADGQTVKLVCLDCHRDNFSSTQGFINHCRIAHKRDFKSHEEAAVRCGQPYDASEGGNAPKDSKASTPSSSPTAAAAAAAAATTASFVHAFARRDMAEQEIFQSLRMRISDSLKLYNQGKLSVVKVPRNVNAVAYPGKASSGFGPSAEAPHLSRLLKARNFRGNLHEVVADAKTKALLEDAAGEESEADGSVSPLRDSLPTRASVVMRMPARIANSPASMGSSARPTSSKGRAAHMALASPSDSDMAVASNEHLPNTILSDEDVDMEDADLSPNTLISNNAPSLVSDDGEYDDSDEGSSVSGASDQLEAESVSDVAEITLDFEPDPRALRRESAGIAGPVRIRKEEAKQVTLIGPVRSSAKERRQRKA
ncbi:ada hat complex component 1 [Trichoderma cornu-damae]|uniref:Ada hat complex component 1 n=1 Tax=Trichoderma cornu-damae TaxID=654480 RepID=A0A9P8QQK0_9HYPO|nr:ada hat complex component 1 [Trichoderma cornu-damae]